MREMQRRLARLEEAEAHPDAARWPDHGMDPASYARAYAQITTLMSTHPTAWPEGMWGAVQAVAAELRAERERGA